MNAAATLFAALPPAVPSGETVPSRPDHTTAPEKSFARVMFQADGNSAKASPDEPIAPPTAPRVATKLDVNTSKSSTLAAVLVQSHAHVPAGATRKLATAETLTATAAPATKPTASPAAKAAFSKSGTQGPAKLSAAPVARTVSAVKPKTDHAPEDEKEEASAKSFGDDSPPKAKTDSPVAPPPPNLAPAPVVPMVFALPVLVTTLPLKPEPRKETGESQIAPISAEGKENGPVKNQNAAATKPSDASSTATDPDALSRTDTPPASPVPTSPKSKPARPAATETPATTAATTSRPAAHGATLLQQVKSLSVLPVSKDTSDGTAGALTSQRMSFSGEKNEIAEATAQKMPPAPQKESVIAKRANEVAAILPSTVDSDAGRQKPGAAAPLLLTDWTAKSAVPVLEAGKSAVGSALAGHAATQAERLGNMVQQQVVLVRQAGLNNLSVSLRLDPQTELNLQLTTHNGQIEAAIRMERGSVQGLANHWKDLQDSLARQNVQLLPLENKPVPRSAASTSLSYQNSSSSFRQPSQNPSRQGREARQELELAAALASAPVLRKTAPVTTVPVRPGLETWA